MILDFSGNTPRYPWSGTNQGMFSNYTMSSGNQSQSMDWSGLASMLQSLLGPLLSQLMGSQQPQLGGGRGLIPQYSVPMPKQVPTPTPQPQSTGGGTGSTGTGGQQTFQGGVWKPGDPPPPMPPPQGNEMANPPPAYLQMIENWQNYTKSLSPDEYQKVMQQQFKWGPVA